MKKENCLFCWFVDRSIDTPWIFWEDEEFMAFLTIFPNTKGATVVIPKKHYPSDVLALDDKILQKFILSAKKVSNILLAKYEDVGRVGLIMEWTGINHAHIKLYPMHWTDYLKRGEWKALPATSNTYFETYEGYLSSSDSEMVSNEEIQKMAEMLMG